MKQQILILLVGSLMTLLWAPTAWAQTCGNSALERPETCDDGNTGGADGCSSSCDIETGWGCSCATPLFAYSSEALAGRVGGNGGSVGPQMGCTGSDILIGLAIGWSNGQGTATKTRAICGTLQITDTGFVTSTKSTTQESGGNGWYGWAPFTWSAETVCPTGTAVVGLRGKRAGSTLFSALSLVCQAVNVDGNASGPKTIVEIPGGNTPTRDQNVDCPSGQIARYFQTRAGAGQDALDMFCAQASATCNGAKSICATRCGDGTVGAPIEDCDEGGETATCDTDCTVAECGDGITNSTAGETCDDTTSPGAAGDGCDANCQADAGWVCPGDGTTCFNTCGNGAVDNGEECDDSNADDDDGCSANCYFEAGFTCSAATGPCASTCGDGMVVGNEVCDDGNMDNGDACTNACVGGIGAACASDVDCAGVCNPTTTACAVADVCGNGVQETGESCDDGNTVNSDGCSSSCKLEIGIACTAGADCAEGICDTLDSNTCEHANVCGNGTLDTGESCDDGNTADNDACSANCKLSVGQACTSDSACVTNVCNLGANGNNQCAAANTCGNGKIEGTEQCDDGNQADDTNGCAANCLLTNGQACTSSPQCQSGVCDLLGSNTCEAAATCGNGKIEAGEFCDDGNTTDGDGCTAICFVEESGSCTADAQCLTGLCNVTAGTCAIAATCGNGRLETGEQCDDGNTNDSDACSNTCLVGAGLTCNGPGCTSGTVCDLKDSFTCEPADVCGNGVIESGERCDDGNTTDGDGCSAICFVEPGASCSVNADCLSALCSTVAGGVCVPANQCGNGVVESGEQCDDANTDDGDACSNTCLLGGGTTCAADAGCALTFVCDTATSYTCEPADQCGNGKVEAGESCDDGNVVSGDGCSAICIVEAGGRCTSDSQCLTTVCDTANDGVCEAASVCGNGKIETGELCDDGNTDNSDACTNTCQFGLGVTCNADAACSSGEVCDTVQSYTCEPVNTCGNGKLEAGEVCDDGNATDDGNGCAANCLFALGTVCTANSDCASTLCDTVGNGVCENPNTCGNGTVEAGEFCDDGNTTDGDGCTAICFNETGGGCAADSECLSTVCNPSTNACNPANLCGNGKLENTEVCDDGNSVNGDGCSILCTVELGGACAQNADCLSNVCHPTLNTCQVQGVCGNGAIEPGEYCDDGNVAANDGCSGTCHLENGQACTSQDSCAEVCNTAVGQCQAAGVCGNGVPEAPEVCDDGGTADGDGCNAACLAEVGGPCLTPSDCSTGLCNTTTATCRPPGECGNGAVEAGETCDDGNLANGDGCDFLCKFEVGEACVDDADCATGAVCDLADSNTCELADECGNGVVEGIEICDDGNTDGSDACSASCKLSDLIFCSVDNECESGRCGVDGLCGGAPDQSCVADADCRQGLACDAGSARCGVPDGAACTADSECQSGGCSNSGTCLVSAGNPCADAMDCAGGVCGSDGNCGALAGASCSEDQGCRDAACDFGQMICLAPNGATCTNSNECAAGNCFDGACGKVAGTMCAFSYECQSSLCDATSSTCLGAPGEACTAGTDCASGACGADGMCGLASGADCTADDECRDSFCDPADSVCGPQDGRACTSDDRCRSGLCNLAGGSICAATDLCGNGAVEDGEVCDDGNTDAGDNCGPDCKLPIGGTCTDDADCSSGMCSTDGVCTDGTDPDMGPDMGGDDDMGGEQGLVQGGACSGCASAPGQPVDPWMAIVGLMFIGMIRRRRNRR